MQYLYHLIVHWGSGGHKVNICIYKSTNYIMQTSGNNGRRKGHSHQTHLSVCWLVHNLSGTWILDIYTPQFLCLGHLLTSHSQCTGFQKFLKNHGENFHFYSVSFEYNCNLPEVEGHMFMLLIVAEVQSLQVIMSKCFGRNAKLHVSLCSINIYTVSFWDKYVLFRVVCILGEEYNH